MEMDIRKGNSEYIVGEVGWGGDFEDICFAQVAANLLTVNIC